MHYKTAPSPKSEIEISVEITPEEAAGFFNAALKKITEESEIDGFRKGKAPQELVLKKLGEFKVWERASVLGIEDTYPKILGELKSGGKEFEPIGPPKIEVTKLAKGGPIEYKALLALLPVFSLPDYKAIAREILPERKKPEVDEKEVEDAVDYLRQSRASVITVSREAKSGDRVEIDFKAASGGAGLAGGASKNHPLIIGEGKFIPGFEDNIRGMRAGEHKNFSLPVPDDYVEPSLRGKTLDFEVDMKLVQERILPELTDEFTQNLGSFRDAAHLKNSIREGVSAEKEAKERERIRMRIIEAVAEKTAIDIPDILVQRETEKMLEELRSNLERMGLGWSDYLAGIKKDEAALKNDWQPDAERRVKIALITRKIAETEKIEPNEEEIQNATNQSVARMGMDEEGLKKIDREAFLEYNTSIARNEGVFKFLENLTIGTLHVPPPN